MREILCSGLVINPLTANHNNCRLLCHLLVILKVFFANSVDPDQTASSVDPDQSLLWVHTVCLYAEIGLKCLQEYSADYINRQQPASNSQPRWLSWMRRPTGDQEVGNILSWRLIMKYFLWSFSPFR